MGSSDSINLVGIRAAGSLVGAKFFRGKSSWAWWTDEGEADGRLACSIGILNASSVRVGGTVRCSSADGTCVRGDGFLGTPPPAAAAAGGRIGDRVVAGDGLVAGATTGETVVGAGESVIGDFVGRAEALVGARGVMDGARVGAGTGFVRDERLFNAKLSNEAMTEAQPVLYTYSRTRSVPSPLIATSVA